MITLKSLRISFAAGALAVCGASSPAFARDWPTTAGWDIFEGDDYCGMALEYDGKGDTVLSVAKRLDGDSLAIVTNYAWSAKKGEVYDLKFYVGNQVFSGGKSIGTGESYERKGFITLFGADFFPAFSSGSSFKVYKGDTLVDSLSLVGSASASAMVSKCLAHVQGLRAAEERERERFAHIPDDPFAEAKTTPATVEARSGAENWVSVDDYPPSSIRAREEGTTHVKYTVNASGRVENCVVTTSSGSPALDRATCSSLTRRGKYKPTAQSTERTTSYTWLYRRTKYPACDTVLNAIPFISTAGNAIAPATRPHANVTTRAWARSAAIIIARCALGAAFSCCRTMRPTW